MPDLITTQRLQPSLLDRLTDHHPRSATEHAEARLMSETALREAVRRDLAWLLSTTRLSSVRDFSSYAHVRASVLDFGIAALAGKTESSLERGAIEETVREAILRFEPRLVPATVVVRGVPPKVGRRSNAIALEIEAELWMQPLPLPILLQAELDLESGAVNVREARDER